MVLGMSRQQPADAWVLRQGIQVAAFLRFVDGTLPPSCAHHADHCGYWDCGVSPRSLFAVRCVNMRRPYLALLAMSGSGFLNRSSNIDTPARDPVEPIAVTAVIPVKFPVRTAQQRQQSRKHPVAAEFCRIVEIAQIVRVILSDFTQQREPLQIAALSEILSTLHVLGGASLGLAQQLRHRSNTSWRVQAINASGAKGRNSGLSANASNVSSSEGGATLAKVTAASWRLVGSADFS